MLYRRLGKSNLRVSRLCVGSMMFGDQTDAVEAGNILASARERGINFIDTADVYSRGGSERMLGTLLQGSRDNWVLASKLGYPMTTEPNHSRYSRKWIMQALDASLARLATDYLDILYLHCDFAGDNLEETVLALGDLIRSGKIRSFGLSNFRGWRIAEVMRLCGQLGVPQPVVCQPYYNLLNRVPEVEILPACRHYGIGVVPYSPIARGVLTGKYLPGASVAVDTRAGRGDKRMLETEFRPESLHIAQELKRHCEERGIELGHFATAWVLASSAVSAVIAGPRTLAQMESYYPALELAISGAEEALVDSLVAPGHASTPGYNDAMHPFFGRASPPSF